MSSASSREAMGLMPMAWATFSCFWFRSPKVRPKLATPWMLRGSFIFIDMSFFLHPAKAEARPAVSSRQGRRREARWNSFIFIACFKSFYFVVFGKPRAKI